MDIVIIVVLVVLPAIDDIVITEAIGKLPDNPRNASGVVRMDSFEQSAIQQGDEIIAICPHHHAEAIGDENGDDAVAHPLVICDGEWHGLQSLARFRRKLIHNLSLLRWSKRDYLPFFPVRLFSYIILSARRAVSDTERSSCGSYSAMPMET